MGMVTLQQAWGPAAEAWLPGAHRWQPSPCSCRSRCRSASAAAASALRSRGGRSAKKRCASGPNSMRCSRPVASSTSRRRAYTQLPVLAPAHARRSRPRWARRGTQLAGMASAANRARSRRHDAAAHLFVRTRWPGGTCLLAGGAESPSAEPAHDSSAAAPLGCPATPGAAWTTTDCGGCTSRGVGRPLRLGLEPSLLCDCPPASVGTPLRTAAVPPQLVGTLCTGCCAKRMPSRVMVWRCTEQERLRCNEHKQVNDQYFAKQWSRCFVQATISGPTAGLCNQQPAQEHTCTCPCTTLAPTFRSLTQLPTSSNCAGPRLGTTIGSAVPSKGTCPRSGMPCVPRWSANPPAWDVGCRATTHAGQAELFGNTTACSPAGAARTGAAGKASAAALKHPPAVACRTCIPPMQPECRRRQPGNGTWRKAHSHPLLLTNGPNSRHAQSKHPTRTVHIHNTLAHPHSSAHAKGKGSASEPSHRCTTRKSGWESSTASTRHTTSKYSPGRTSCMRRK